MEAKQEQAQEATLRRLEVKKEESTYYIDIAGRRKIINVKIPKFFTVGDVMYFSPEEGLLKALYDVKTDKWSIYQKELKKRTAELFEIADEDN